MRRALQWLSELHVQPSCPGMLLSSLSLPYMQLRLDDRLAPILLPTHRGSYLQLCVVHATGSSISATSTGTIVSNNVFQLRRLQSVGR